MCIWSIWQKKNKCTHTNKVLINITNRKASTREKIPVYRIKRRTSNILCLRYMKDKNNLFFG